MSAGRQLGGEGGYTIGESKQKLDSTRTDCNTHPFLLFLTLMVYVLILQKPGTFIIELNTPLAISCGLGRGQVGPDLVGSLALGLVVGIL